MAYVDVAEVLLDPDLADLFSVVRRTETFANGRPVIATVTTPNVVGVVTATGPSGLERRDDGQMMTRQVNIVTQFRLRGPGTGIQPDQIVIDGNTFTVVDILPFSRFGAGFVEAIAEVMASQSVPPQ